VTTIKRLNEKPDLIPLPKIATLELWELQATLLNVVDKLRDCGHFPLLARIGSYARAFKAYYYDYCHNYLASLAKRYIRRAVVKRLNEAVLEYCEDRYEIGPSEQLSEVGGVDRN